MTSLNNLEHGDIYISKYSEIRSLYPQHIPIFTDGSKQGNHTATDVV